MESQTHHPLRALASDVFPDKDLRALFSVAPDSRAVLFIHGFGGDPINTWTEFHDLLPTDDDCAGVDLLFYGHDGLRSELVASAGLFRDFLGRLFADTSGLINKSLPRRSRRAPSFKYKKLLIVGHSLGAVIARRALADATRARATWVTRTSLVLFAPAHMGARVADLAVSTSGRFSVLGLFMSGARFVSPLIDQLREDSKELADLRTDVEQLTRNRKNPHLVPHQVVIAEYERIVVNRTFPGDPAAIALAKQTHTSLCKPSRMFLKPLELVKACL